MPNHLNQDQANVFYQALYGNGYQQTTLAGEKITWNLSDYHQSVYLIFCFYVTVVFYCILRYNRYLLTIFKCNSDFVLYYRYNSDSFREMDS